ncbi:hypothetical protein GCM10025875_11480 [Litorihabitans aurantiacus]|uniref:Uncharacterized protein n=1 Tax=Litorihabitans aurantiacus TaxID=1930061 RepID=A0AA37XD57_9MICO|nr:hypothetical protein GCM10025875_11480 [Litorihabitans aurantiacus]
MIGPLTPRESLVGIAFTTPSGRPTSRSRSTNARVVSGVSSAGLTTLVHPAARAGAILRVAIARGKFQGVMSRHGPTGTRVTITRPVPSGLRP